MAKTATDPPGTAGSQFFIVTADDAGPPPDYALLDHVVAGWPVVAAIAELGDRASERPWERVVIERIELVERPT
jgi:cyclophilin family peptidyl-prolyl cis-trans isomerase